MGLRFMGRVYPCTRGRGGLCAGAAKAEGDGATPRGVHAIVGALYRADRMARPVRWALPIGPFDLWSDDGEDPDYNQLVRAPHPFSHERLRRGDPMYDLVLVTDWNWPRATPGRGSAIFIHAWRKPGHPTAGCIGLAPGDLRAITRALGPESRLIVP